MKRASFWPRLDEKNFVIIESGSSEVQMDDCKSKQRYFDESTLALAYLTLAGKMSEQGDFENARKYYLRAIRQGLLVRHIQTTGKPSLDVVQEIQVCGNERLLELMCEEESTNSILQQQDIVNSLNSLL